MTNINHKILLGAAITLASLQQASAVPFAPADARAMGMGGTGVSSAEIASTVQFNPALLATTRDDDHFGLKIPQFSLTVADDDGFIDEAEDFDEESDLDASNQDRTNVELLENLLDETVNTSGQGLQLLETALDKIDAGNYISGRTDLNNAFTQIDGRLFDSSGGTPELSLFSNAIADDLDDINNKALRINGGLNIAAAIPSKKFAMAVYAGGQVTFSGKVNVSEKDSALLRNYSDATSEYLKLVNDLRVALNTNDFAAADSAEDAIRLFDYGLGDGEGGTAIFEDGELVASDANLDSEIVMVGVAVADVGLTISRMFNIKGHDISFGITPKLQKVSIFDYKHQLDGKDENGNDVEFDADDFDENQEDYSGFNIDLGAAYQFGDTKQWQTGIVIKNLIGDDYESKFYKDTNGVEGTVVTINPMVRAGISHRTSWTKVAFDLDITENDPVGFEDATQYAAIGGELNVWRIVQLRAGYRANLAGSDQDIMTAGIGLSPGAVHLDIGVMANTSDIENEAGIALEFGVEF
ncbi:MAG: conjugal transfer protein TraF [Bermanella sp.]